MPYSEEKENTGKKKHYTTINTTKRKWRRGMTETRMRMYVSSLCSPTYANELRTHTSIRLNIA